MNHTQIHSLSIFNLIFSGMLAEFRTITFLFKYKTT